MGRRKKYNENDNTGLLGFAIDSLKVIFKLTPDSDQSFFEFIMEKLGALALFVAVIFVIGMIFVAIFFEFIF